jgi:hypothetical protein
MKGVVINTPKLSEYFLDKCSIKGVTVKYNYAATKKTLNAVREFFDKYLSTK